MSLGPGQATYFLNSISKSEVEKIPEELEKLFTSSPEKISHDQNESSFWVVLGNLRRDKDLGESVHNLRQNEVYGWKLSQSTQTILHTCLAISLTKSLHSPLFSIDSIVENL